MPRTYYRPCSIEGCTRNAVCHGWCITHYMRWRANGTTDARVMPTLEQRFWQSINKDGPEHPTLGKCWVWTAHTDKDGYGIIWSENKNVKAHRISWEITNGPITDSLCVLHRCDNPPYSNPSHLFLGTNVENQADKIAKDRHLKGETHGASRLTADQVAEIRRRYVRYSFRRSNKLALAAEFGITAAHVLQLVSKRCWKHVK